MKTIDGIDALASYTSMAYLASYFGDELAYKKPARRAAAIYAALLSRIEAGDRARTKSEERADMIRVLAGLLATHEQLSDVLFERIRKALEP